MRPVNLWFFCISVLWKSNCKEYCQGSARQLHALPASTWHHLGSAWPTNFSPWHRLSVSFSSKLRFFFFLLSFKKAVSPAAQQLCNKEVCQVMSGQTNDGWPTLHACTVHSGVSVFKKKIWKREFVSHKKSILGLKKRQVNSETFGEQLLSGSDVQKRSLCFEFRVAQFYAHSCLRDFRMML